MNPEFIPRSFNYKIKHYVLCLYSQTTRDTEMEEVTRNQEENRKQVETREQEDIQSFPARIPYILIISTHKYILLSFLARIPHTYHFHTQIYIIISGTYTVYTYHFYTHIYIDLSIMTKFLHLISPRQCWMSRIVYSILI